MSLPAGSVLGIDVGFSDKDRSSAACRLDWMKRDIRWTCARFRYRPEEMRETITRVVGQEVLLAAAFDGPLAPAFRIIDSYRTAERMLTRRLAEYIGKPGTSNVPVGRTLNEAANACVQTVRDHCQLASATYAPAIDGRAIVEAFPSSFMGVMLAEPRSPPRGIRRGNRSDVFFEMLTSDGTFAGLLASLLPGRTPIADLAATTNHDDRAALVCALTALCVSAGRFTAVGDARDGYIVLPPRSFVQDWAWTKLRENAGEGPPGRLIG